MYRKKNYFNYNIFYPFSYEKDSFFFLALCMILFSCDKEDAGSSKTETLTNGSWKMRAYMTDYNKDGVYEENTFAFLEDCYKDNIYSFNSNGNLNIYEGRSKCTSIDPQTTTSTWNFQDNESSLQFGGGGRNIPSKN